MELFMSVINKLFNQFTENFILINKAIDECLNLPTVSIGLDKSGYQVNIFLISP